MRKNKRVWLAKTGVVMVMLSLSLSMHMTNAQTITTSGPDFVASNIRMVNVDGNNYVYVQVKNIGTAGVAGTRYLTVSLGINQGMPISGYMNEASYPAGFVKELRFGPFNNLNTTINSNCSRSCTGAITGNCAQTGTSASPCLTCPPDTTLVAWSGFPCGENSGATRTGNTVCSWEGADNYGGPGAFNMTCQKRSLYGNYSMTAKVDFENFYAEINEGNNTLIKTVSMPKPDFAATNIRLTNEAGNYYAYVNVKNYGGGVTASSSAGLKSLWVETAIPGNATKSVALKESFYNTGYNKEVKIGPLGDIGTGTTEINCSTSCSGAVTGNCVHTGTCLYCPAGYEQVSVSGGACGQNSGTTGNCGWEGADNNGAPGWVGVTCRKSGPVDSVSVKAMIDSNNYFEESTELNNVLTRTLAVPKPDFAVSNIRLVNENGLNYVRAVVTNNGEGAGAAISGGVKRLVTCAYANIFTDSANTNIYCTSAYETYYNKGFKADFRIGPINGKLSDFLGTTSTIASVTVLTDYDQKFRETNETNNKLTSNVGIPIADFTVGTVSIVKEGIEYYVYVEVKNIGGGVSGMNGTAIKPLPISAFMLGGVWNFNFMDSYYNGGFAKIARFGPITKYISTASSVSIKTMVDANRTYADKNYTNNTVTRTVVKP